MGQVREEERFFEQINNCIYMEVYKTQNIYIFSGRGFSVLDARIHILDLLNATSYRKLQKWIHGLMANNLLLGI